MLETTSRLSEKELQSKITDSFFLKMERKNHRVIPLTTDELISGPDSSKIYFKHEKTKMFIDERLRSCEKSEVFRHSFASESSIRHKPICVSTVISGVVNGFYSLVLRCFASLKCEYRPIYIIGDISVVKEVTKRRKKSHRVVVSFNFGIPSLGGVPE